MQKPILLFGKPGALAELTKAHVDTYTRSDGSVVQAHDDSRQAAAPKPVAPKGKAGAHPLSVAADKHDAAAEKHRKLAAEKGEDHPEYKIHRDAATSHARAAYHARQVVDGSDDFRAHLKGHDDSAKQASSAESTLAKRKKVQDAGNALMMHMHDQSHAPKNIANKKKAADHRKQAEFHAAAARNLSGDENTHGRKAHEAAAEVHAKAAEHHESGHEDAKMTSQFASKESRYANKHWPVGEK